ncbi:MAG: saccharopine dehydrogenase NADP-binding domain-containing protein [Candidatus Eisenbacteria bacterium]|nr:saccharopine dehydrogenase NADP-binding domain-containing protein [Candidatus Eisenbacteria bacterium]
MRVLLLGVGMQGKAALYDLLLSDRVEQITAADWDIEGLRAHVAGLESYRLPAARLAPSRLACEPVDASDASGLERLFASKPDVVIDLLPPALSIAAARAAVAHGAHLVSTCYARPEVVALGADAESRGLSILPEFGMDPGIDLVLMGAAVRALDRVDSLRCYGSGIPEPSAADNPLRYKISWTFEGVLRAYRRPARLVQEGRLLELSAEEIYAPAHLHTLAVPGMGNLEAIPNGDALSYAPLLGLDPARMRTLGRYTLRYPGHCDFWRAIVALHLLDEEPVRMNGVEVDRLQYLVTALTPHLQYEENERDMAILHIEARGMHDGKPAREGYRLIDRKDLETGLSAMSRAVGFTASIGAHMIVEGSIERRGLLSPVNDVPCEPFLAHLERRGIQVKRL